MKKALISSTILATILLSGCGETSTPEKSTQTESSTRPITMEEVSTENSTQTESIAEEVNKAPIVNAGIDKTVTINETTIVTGTASDSDGTISSIEWEKGNEVLATTLSFTYIPTVEGTDTLTLKVIDNDGATASDSTSITVEAVSNTDSDLGDKK